MDSSLNRQIKIYCPEHHTTFETVSGPKIVCEIREHSLSNNFPCGEFWEYCCDCQTFFPSDLEVGGKSKHTCRQCERITTQRFLCNECKIVALDSVEETKGEVYEIDPARGIKPSCPGCQKHFVDEKFYRHICSAVEADLTTAREQCPFCKKNISALQSSHPEFLKTADLNSLASAKTNGEFSASPPSEFLPFASQTSLTEQQTQPILQPNTLPATSDISNNSKLHLSQPAIIGLALIGTILIIAIFIIMQKNQIATYGPVSNSTYNSPGVIRVNNFTNNPVSSNNSRPRVIDSSELTSARQEVSDALFRWKSDAESLNFSDYMSNYADTVDYYRAGKSARSRVANDKQRAFRLYSSIQIELNNIQITPASEGNKATIIVDKSWNFKGNQKATEGEVQQQLLMAKINGRWYITGEKDLKVYRSRSY